MSIRKLSHSSMACWRRCRARFYWQYIENYTSASSIGQARGSAGHAALAKWYSMDREKNSFEFRVQEAMKAADATFREFEESSGRTYEEEYDQLGRILHRYYDFSEKVDIFQVVSLEKHFEIQAGDYPIIGFIDAVVSIKGNIWLMEHKFNKKVETNHIDLDMQMGIYMWAATKLGLNPRGVIYNVIRMTEGGIAEKEPVKRVMVYRNLKGLGTLEKEMKMQAEEIQDYINNGGAVYRNPTSDCSWDCSFYNVCLAMNDDGNAESVLRTMMRKEPEGDEKGE